MDEVATTAIPITVRLHPKYWRFCNFFLSNNFEKSIVVTIADPLKIRKVDPAIKFNPIICSIDVNTSDMAGMMNIFEL